MTILHPVGDAFSRLVACSRLVGQKFCEALVEAMAEITRAETVLIARLETERPGWVKTVAVWSKGALLPNFEYDLAGSPCSDVMSDGMCFFPDNVVAQFPKDILLVEMGARGYLGAPLFNHEGQAVGVLAAISNKALALDPEVRSLFEIFASRVAAELDRDGSVSRAEYLGRLIDGSASEIFVFDAATLKFVLVNEGARENLGYSMEELATMTPVDLKPEYTEEAFKALLEPLISGRENLARFRTRHRRRDGSLYPVDVKLQKICGLGATVFYAAIEDITERLAVRKQLEETRQRLERLFNQSPAGIVEADVNGRMTLVNPTWCDMLGYTKAELESKNLIDLTHPDSLPQTLAAIEHLRSGGDAILVEKNYMRKDQRPVAALSNVSALRNEDGEFLGIAAVVSDVTQRLQAEELVRESEARLRKILDGTLAFVGVLDPDGTLIEANATAIAATGLSREDVVGKKFWDCFWWSYSPTVVAKLKDAIASAMAGNVVRYDETIRVRDDGRLTIDFMLSPYFADDGRVEFLVPSGVDITERKRQEAMLHELMREVNHRSKNLLSVVQAIARQMPATAPEVFKLQLSQRLRSLAACQDVLVNSGWQSVKLTELLQSQLAHFGDLIGNRIQFDGPELSISPAATQALGMAVYELATNATKYGALSNDRGVVEINWHITKDAQPRFLLHWKERGGPAVEAPSDAGFGSKVLNDLVSGMLNGKSTSVFGREGYEWRIDCNPRALNYEGRP